MAIMTRIPAVVTTVLYRQGDSNSWIQLTYGTVDIPSNMWYHDGMTIKSNCENEGVFDKLLSRELLKCKRKILFLVVYAKV